MALARVVAFENVPAERMQQLEQEIRDDPQPENIPATEIMILHDPESGKALAVLFFESEDDYRRGDEALNAMPADETPGSRTSVSKYQVAIRMTR
jgi:hypothetical protein